MFIMEATPTPQRILPPATADAISHKFSIGGHEYYAIISKYQEGHPAMLDVKGAKEGSIVNGLFDGLSLTTSLALQYGIPLDEIVSQWEGKRFEPSGFTENMDYPTVKSPLDYLARWVKGSESLPEPKLLAQPHPATRIMNPQDPVYSPVTHKFSIDGHEGYLTVWAAERAKVANLSIRFAKEDSSVYGLCDGVCDTAAIALQHGVPLQALVEEWKGLRFEPSGFTSHQSIPRVKSLLDYVARYLELNFLPPVETKTA